MIAKVTLLCALVAIARAGVLGGLGYGYAAAPVAHVAATPVYRQAPALSYAAPALSYAAPQLLAAPAIKVAAPVVAKAIVAEAAQPYEFGYSHQLEDGTVANRHEVSDASNSRQGSYGYTGADGIYRQVDYVADALGYRATVRTNEPGTAPQNPAATQLLSEEAPYKVLPAPAPVVKAIAQPIIAKAAIAAPVYAHAAAPVYAHAAAPVYAHATAPVYAHAAAPVYAHAAAPVYAHAAPVYAHAAPASVAYKTLHSAPAVVKTAIAAPSIYGAAYGGAYLH